MFDVNMTELQLQEMKIIFVDFIDVYSPANHSQTEILISIIYSPCPLAL